MSFAAHRAVFGAHRVVFPAHHVDSGAHRVVVGAHHVVFGAHRMVSGAHRVVFRAHCMVSGAHRVVFGAHRMVFRAHRVVSGAHRMVFCRNQSSFPDDLAHDRAGLTPHPASRVNNEGGLSHCLPRAQTLPDGPARAADRVHRRRECKQIRRLPAASRPPVCPESGPDGAFDSHSITECKLP